MHLVSIINKLFQIVSVSTMQSHRHPGLADLNHGDIEIADFLIQNKHVF